jgi:hypothetical protein
MLVLDQCVQQWDKNDGRRLKTFPSLPMYSDSSRDVKTEIAPIPEIRALPAVRAPQAEMRPPTIFDIDAAARPGGGGEQRSGRKAAGAEESHEDDLQLEGEPAGGAQTVEDAPPKQVDYFA